MKILITNDDGVFAPGLLALIKGLKDEHDLTIVAPKIEQSGKSRAITLYQAISMQEVLIRDAQMKAYAIDGTPSDCVRIGLKHLLKYNVDLVISGVNHGVNTANDVPYSGTVSAALEALIYGIPAIALSSVRKGIYANYEIAVQEVKNLIKVLPESFYHSNYMLNINTPFCETDEVRGRVVLKNTRNLTDEYEEVGSIGDVTYLQITNRYPKIVEKTRDLYYLRENYITISPLTDGWMTHKETLNTLQGWVDQIP